ncbi:acyl carrier protein [Paenibacillus luteus]|uniref:acyl carrier protein n=1 Tax=Paenibacillus luteus TaxID=2545753 RepID=UPI0011451087|nr:phosphopantetheine-binding protein [Paenibacillus luteus]
MKNKLLDIINEMMEEAGTSTIEELKEEMSLRDDLKMDSLMLAELTVRIEDEFEVDLFEDGIVRTVAEVLAKIERS